MRYDFSICTIHLELLPHKLLLLDATAMLQVVWDYWWFKLPAKLTTYINIPICQTSGWSSWRLKRVANRAASGLACRLGETTFRIAPSGKLQPESKRRAVFRSNVLQVLTGFKSWCRMMQVLLLTTDFFNIMMFKYSVSRISLYVILYIMMYIAYIYTYCSTYIYIYIYIYTHPHTLDHSSWIQDAQIASGKGTVGRVAAASLWRKWNRDEVVIRDAKETSERVPGTSLVRIQCTFHKAASPLCCMHFCSTVSCFLPAPLWNLVALDKSVWPSEGCQP